MISVYNMKNKLEMSAEIQVDYFQLGNIELLNRPQVPAADLIAAGWTDAGTGTATVFSTSYSAGDDGYEWNQNILLHMTPIKPNGDVVSPDSLDSYVETLLTESTIEDILTTDAASYKLVIWVQEVPGSWDSGYERGELYDDLLHRLQAVYYLHDLEEFPTENELKEFNEEISVFPSFDGNGDAVLMPTKCVVKNVAAGQYDLTMDHPIDPDGKWAHLQPEAIVKAPIPAELIENAFAGLEADVYKTTEKAALREGPAEPTPITYDAWSITANYSVGSKVTFFKQNYQCTYWDDDDAIHKHLAPSGSGWWTKIANMTEGYPVLVQNRLGAELYYVSGPENGWYKMSTTYGLEGYIKESQVVYDRHLTPSETHDRLVTEQLFRIKKVAVDTKNMNVNVTAEHVSYDLSGVMMENVKIVNQPPAQALSWLENAFMIDYQGSIASNIIESEDRLYTAELSGKNGMYAILDPDKGVVAQFEAAFRRDNWDLFVMEKTNTDQGFRITYGNNLLGVNWKIASDQLITRIVPVAKDEDGSDLYLTDEDEEEGDYYTNWIDSDLIANYPVIRMERLKVDGQVGKDDGTETGTTWTKAALRAEMEKQALARYSIDKVDQLKHEITIDFVRLGDTDEYKQFKDLQKVRLYDTVIAVDPRIDLSVSVQVTEIEFDAVNERITAMKLSNIEAYNLRSVTGFNVMNNSITGDKLTDEAGRAIVGTIQQDAVAEANNYTSGSVQALRQWVQNNFEPIS